MSAYRAYAKNKATTTDWLGSVPEHWKIVQIKHLTAVRRGASPRPIDAPRYFDSEGEFAWVRIADVSASERYLESTTQRLSDIGENLSVKMLPNDIFLSIAGTVGKPIITRIKCCIHDGFVYFPDFKENKEFLYYVFACGQPYLGLGKMGTQLNLNTDTVGSISIGLPPMQEQAAIVDFLDYKTAQIDALIAKKQALLEKLAEKRTALISHAVTKGLDPSVPMKDSGVAWLGEIPAHWVCPPLYSRHTIELGKMLDESRISGKYLVPYLRNIDVQWDEINTQDLPVMDIRPDEFCRYLVQPGDLLVCEGGEVGRAAIVGDEAGLLGYQKALHRLRVVDSNRENSRFMFYTLCWASGAGLFLAEGNPNTIPHLTGERLRRYRFPCPPIEEQKSIAGWLDKQCKKIAQQQEMVSGVIERLQEYRSALITNAVTGKIDVRNFNRETADA